MSVTFTNASTDTFRASFNWNMGNGNSYTSFQVPVQTYLQSIRTDTFYYINHSISNFCGNFIKKDTVRVLPKPTSFFLTNTDSGCSPLPVFMLNQSFGVPQQFLWHFGNGESSTRQIPIQNPIVYSTIDTPSTYTIRLIVTNICGTDTSYRKVKVMPNTVKSFFTANVQNGCDQLTVQFTNYAIGGQNVSYNFGDGNGSTIKNPTHTFSNPGTYRVFQFVNNNCSFDTSSLLINVYPSPRFTIEKITSSNCVKSPVFFKANIQDPGTLTWYFGNGDSSQLISPVYYYQTGGFKVFKATMVSNFNYCSRTITDSVFINVLPGARIIADTLRACQNVQFRFKASTLQPSFLIWDFGDSTFRLGDSITQLFNKSGNYNIRLMATNAAGCSDTATNNVTVYPIPVASFTLNPKDTCNGPAWVNFTNTSVGANAYQWTFGNGNNSSNVNERQLFSGIGKYNNQLIATNSFLCKDTSEAIFEIFEKPVPAFTFTPSSLCVGQTVSFTNNSKLGVRYVWFFGDGDSSTLENPTHIYKDSGQYKVTLYVYAGTNCFDSLSNSQFITVHPKPVPSFTHELLTIQKPYRKIDFASTSLNGSQFEWDFGDGKKGTGRTTSNTYADADSGCFTVKLRVMSINNCDSAIADTVCLPGYWNGLFVPNAFTPDYGTPEVRVFKPVGIELKTYHLKIFNKWGELVWESSELVDGMPAMGWDGTNINDGSACMQGTYIWTIEAVFTDGGKWQGMLYPGALKPKDKNGNVKSIDKGNVTLIR
jgi:PKD repeat protein